MGWLHANDKPVIIGLLSHSKPYAGAQLDIEFYFKSLLFQGLSLEEMADMPSYNLLETTHNKWLQQSSNCGNDLFAATYNDRLRAIMQMTNYMACLKGKASGTGLSK